MSLMHGPHFAKNYVTSYLQQDMPIRLIRYRNGWNVDDITLPDPLKYLSYEPVALDHWPTIITVAISTNSMSRIGYDGADPLYRVQYSMRTYAWVRTEHAEECTLMRDRLTTVLRSALLDYPCLKAIDERDSFKVMIDEGTMREEFSDLTLLKGDRFLAGAYVSYNLEIDEVVTRLDLGTVGEIDLRVLNVGPEEEMPEFSE
jgi:hypothetical protein